MLALLNFLDLTQLVFWWLMRRKLIKEVDDLEIAVLVDPHILQSHVRIEAWILINKLKILLARLRIRNAYMKIIWLNFHYKPVLDPLQHIFYRPRVVNSQFLIELFTIQSQVNSQLDDSLLPLRLCFSVLMLLWPVRIHILKITFTKV